jgi:hypothetical protein
VIIATSEQSKIKSLGNSLYLFIIQHLCMTQKHNIWNWMWHYHCFSQ